MAVKTENDLSEQARALFLKAQSAAELRNFGYAITLLLNVLKDEPAFLEGRRLLRKVEVANTRGKKSTFLGLDTSGLSLSSLKLGGKGPKDPLQAILAAEKILETDPYNESANLALRDAAMAAEMVETATFALETLAEGHPKSPKLLHELGRHYTQLEMHEKAVAVYNRIISIAPNDLQAAKLSKDSAARLSMRQEGWDSAESGDYRKLIKNVDEAVSLEQKNRFVKSEDVIDQQLAELYAKIEGEPQNIDLVRRYASLCDQKGDLELALQWYTYANELSGGTDGGLLRRITEVQGKILEARIREHESEHAAMAEDDPRRAGISAKLETLRHERHALIINEARKSVERNPTDLVLRFELGQYLVEDGQYSEAIKELQKARNSPNTRVRATYLLGRCYEAKNMHDLARDMLLEASNEYTNMDNTKKEILYLLGKVYDRMGSKKEALETFKQIYAVDYDFRDVAQLVEESYAGAGN